MNLAEKFSKLVELENPKIAEKYKNYPRFNIKAIDWYIRISPNGSGEIAAEYFSCGDTEMPFYVDFTSFEDLERVLDFALSLEGTTSETA